MKIPIDQIQIDEAARIRKEIGNLAPLEESIQTVGLINPILIDEQRTLLAGTGDFQHAKTLAGKRSRSKWSSLAATS